MLSPPASQPRSVNSHRTSSIKNTAEAAFNRLCFLFLKNYINITAAVDAGQPAPVGKLPDIIPVPGSGQGIVFGVVCNPDLIIRQSVKIQLIVQEALTGVDPRLISGLFHRLAEDLGNLRPHCHMQWV